MIASLVAGWLAASVRTAEAQDPKVTSADHGVVATLVYGGTTFFELDGGIERGGTYSGNLNLRLAIDGDRLFGATGLTFYVDGLWIHGGQPSELAGDAQGVSNLSARPAITLYEAWAQYNFPGNRLSILVGRYDLNAEFYRLQSAGLFVNSSFGIGPEFSASGVEGPSIFPRTSLGVRLALKPKRGIVLRGAVLDGVPVDRPDGSAGAFKRGDGLLLVSEAALLNRTADGERRSPPRVRIGRASGLPPYDHKLAVGGWYYTATFGDLSAVDMNGHPIQHRGSGGIYGVVDATVFRSDTASGKRMAAFLEGGLGDGRLNQFGSFVGGGLVATGPLSKRSLDELGLAVALGRNGAAYMDRQARLGVRTNAAESVFELTYLAQIASWLAIQPDFQCVIHPSTNAALSSARAFQIRFETTF